MCFPECKASACINKPDEKHSMYVNRWLKGSAALCHSLNRADTKRCASLAGEQDPCSNSGAGHSPRLFVTRVTWKVAKSGWKLLKEQWGEFKHDIYSASERDVSRLSKYPNSKNVKKKNMFNAICAACLLNDDVSVHSHKGMGFLRQNMWISLLTSLLYDSGVESLCRLLATSTSPLSALSQTVVNIGTTLAT